MYDSINELGGKLRDSKPTYDSEGNCYPAKFKLTTAHQHRLERDIKVLTQHMSRYLDSNGVKLPKPLWWHDRKHPVA